MKIVSTAALALATLTCTAMVHAQEVPTTTVTGISAAVDVATPFTQVPTIIAQNELDAAFVQGYLHARDRFFQMDITRRTVSGTLAELVGPSVIGSDIQLRTLGLRRAAWESWAALSDNTRAILRAYANGVNAWLADNPVPLEYGLLELTSAEPWQPVDSVVVGKGLAFQLSFDLEDIDYTVAIGTYQAVGQAVGFNGTALFFEDVYRTAPPDNRVTVPGFLNSIGGLGKSGLDKSLADNFPIIPADRMNQTTRLRDQYRANPYLAPLMNNTVEDKGSNFWLAAGSITSNGLPILANDPHLSLDVPSVFVPNHIFVGDDDNTISNTSGVSVPGVPGIVQGCNDNLCWGSTVNPIDETDSFFEDLRVNSLGLPTHTMYQGVAEPIVWIYQSYFANNVGDGDFDNVSRLNIGVDGGAITFVVPRRNNGPIVDIDGTTGVSVQYTGWGATREIEAFLDAGKARDVFEFQTALEKFDFGAQNFGVADSAGNIAYFAGGEIPVRTDLQTLMAPDGGIPPVFIRDGSGQLAHEWLPVTNPQPNQATPSEILPINEQPQLVNPDNGYITNANNDPVGTSLDNNALNQVRPGGGLYYLSPGGYPGLRMGRIDRLMADAAANGNVDASQMKAFQADNQLLDAELLMDHIFAAYDNGSSDDAWPPLAALAGDPRMTDLMDVLSTWNFSTPTGIVEGYDPGDNFSDLPEPSETEIRHSVAAAVYSGWRSAMIGNTVDATLTAVGLGGELPPGSLAVSAMMNLLQSFDQNQGVGASGLNFFTNPNAPTPADARDLVILASFQQTLDLYASEDFDRAFAQSSNVMDYRWGRLHRLRLDHPLTSQLSLPDDNGQYPLVTQPGLIGVARAGGYQVLDASSHNPRADGVEEFRFGSGPARRFVGTVLPEGISAEQVIPGGQNGQFGSPLYANQFFVWLVNGYLPVFISPDRARDSGPVQRFTPGN